MADQFFDEANQAQAEQTEQVAETIKLGDKEYSQEDLNKLVGLGEMAVEFEEKWNTKIDKVYPKFTKTTQELAEAKAKLLDYESKQQAQPTSQQQADLTAEQQAEVKRQLAQLGYSEDNYRQIVREELAARDLLSDVDNVLADAKSSGQPSTSPQDLLQHMSDTGIKNPMKAYKDMFEDELDRIKEKKIAEIRPQGMTTTNGAQAGSKQPAPVGRPKNRSELEKMVRDALGGQS